MISAVIPMWDEEKNCVRFVRRLSTVLRCLDEEWEIVALVGGTDATLDALREWRWENQEFRLRIFTDRERGLGKALRQGFSKVDPKAEWVVTMDADGSHVPEELFGLWDRRFDWSASRTLADAVVGERSYRYGTSPMSKILLSRLVNLVFNLAFRTGLRDHTGDYRLYRSASLFRVSPMLRGADYAAVPELVVLMARLGMNLRPAPITYAKRNGGRSKMRLLRLAREYLSVFVLGRK